MTVSRSRILAWASDSLIRLSSCRGVAVTTCQGTPLMGRRKACKIQKDCSPNSRKL